MAISANRVTGQLGRLGGRLREPTFIRLVIVILLPIVCQCVPYGGPRYYSPPQWSGTWHDPNLEAEYEELFENRDDLDPVEGFWQSRNEHGEGMGVCYKTDPKENNGFLYAARGIRESRNTALPYPFLEGKVGARWNPSAEPNVFRGQVLMYRGSQSFWVDATARLLDSTTSEITVHISERLIGGNVQRCYFVGPEKELHARLDAASARKPSKNENRARGGSGFLINDNLIVTNHHVVVDSTVIRCFIKDQSFDANIVSRDQSNDLALLQIQEKPGRGHVFLQIGDAFSVNQGQSVFAMGFPLTDLLGSQMRVHSGIISALTGYEGRSSQFQLEMTLNPGNSGGPVLDRNGRVIGVVTSKLGLGLTADGKISIPEGVVFAVKADAIRSLLSAAGKADAVQTTEGAKRDYSAEDVVSELGKAVVRIECEAKSDD